MKTTLTTLLLFLFTVGIYAQPGEIDRTFNARLGAGANAAVNAVAVQNDGKILMVGEFTNYAYTGRNRIARLNIDGTFDTSFNIGSGANSGIAAVALQADGKILISGEFTSFNGVNRNRIARLNADGTVDTTFNSGTGINFYTSLAIQTDGKIIIGGFFAAYGGVVRNNIARLNTDGTLDTTFNAGIGPNSTVQEVALDTNGKIVLVGNFTTVAGTSRNRIARLNSDGILDVTFNPGIAANNSINSVAIQTDQKILIGGLFSTYGNVSRNLIARVNPDGTLDTTFNPAAGANSIVQKIISHPDGKITISGMFTTYNNISRNRIARINNDGTLDPTFDPGTGANNNISSFAVKADGQIIISGNFTSYNDTLIGRIGQLNADGNLNTTFLNPGGFGSGLSHNVEAIILQADGKIILAGEVQIMSYNGVSRNKLVRLNTDGTLDTSFVVGTGPSSTVFSMAQQTDGKILIVGRFAFYNGVSRNAITRINADGSLDTTFNPGTGANNFIHSVKLQTDGKILIGGSFTSFNGVNSNRIARLNADGTLDNTFAIGTGANNNIFDMAIQPNGKILIVGHFTSFNGIIKRFITRLETNGTIDTTFNEGGSGAGNFPVLIITLQSDGKILIGGSFDSYNGVGRGKIARLNADGSLDATFIPETIFFANPIGGVPSTNPDCIAVQSDGKILIGGRITSYGVVPKINLVRMNSNGTHDATFDGGAGFATNLGTGGRVDDIVMQTDGKILISGTFRLYNTNPVGSIVRIISDVVPLNTLVFNKNPISIYPNPSNGTFTIQTENAIENALISVSDLNGRMVFTTKSDRLDKQILDLNHLQNGIYILNISNGNTKYSRKLIKN